MIAQVFDITVPWITRIPARQVPCLLCGERNIVRLNTCVLNGKRFYTVRCLADGMMWLDPQPTKEFYEALYDTQYHLAGSDDPLIEQATLDVHSDETILREKATSRLDELERFYQRGRLLEVGYGSGHTLMEAQARGWDVLGMELSQTCVDAMNAIGIPALKAHLPNFREPCEPFDVVALYSVIEHTHNPLAYLRRAHELLKPNGLLVLRLPDTDDAGPPASLIAHLYHFNQTTITEVLRRCGFAVMEFTHRYLWKPIKYPGALWSVNVISRKLIG